MSKQPENRGQDGIRYFYSNGSLKLILQLVKWQRYYSININDYGCVHRFIIKYFACCYVLKMVCGLGYLKNERLFLDQKDYGVISIFILYKCVKQNLKQ